jgi:ATP-dependent Clp protease adaptor protein ClpS
MSKDQTQIQEQIATRSKDQIDEPRLYKVLLHNDNYTTMDFVVQVLEIVFCKTPAEATRIMLNVHQQGVGVCGTYTAEIAETKVAMVNHMAQQRGFPLKCSMEEA